MLEWMRQSGIFYFKYAGMRYKVNIRERIKLKEAYKLFGKSNKRNNKARKFKKRLALIKKHKIADKNRQQQNKVKKWTSYKEYLFSKEWQIKRKQKLKQVGNCCQSCDSKNDLQIHHKTYKRIYDEKFKDLIVLCSSCHKKSHKLSIEEKMIDQHLKAILKEV